MLRPRSGALVAALAALLLTAPAIPASAAGAPPQRTWHADQVRVPEARAAGRGGEGVVVAVLDTWVDGAHRDFEGRVLPGADCTGGTCREGAGAADDCTHGTHVAGTVASSSYGVAPRATVLPVKVLAYRPPRPGQEGTCSGSEAGVAAGIRYAVAQGARVLNLSLGTLVPGLSSSSVITAAVNDAARAGAVVVFAAGNSSVPVADSYGGNALIVAATGPEERLALYSQRGAGVTVAAPGGDPPTVGDCSKARCVTSLFPSGRYAVAAGTSMAAPHVAGVAALLLGQDPARTRQQVVDRIRATARPVAGGGAGDGLVDAAAALAGAPAGPPAAVVPPAGGGGPAPRPGAPAAGTAQPTRAPAGGSGGAAPAPTGATAPVAPGVVPVEPEPLPADQPPPEVAGAPADAAGPEQASAPDAGSALPTGPPALAAGLLLAAGLSTALAGLRARPPRR